MEKYIHILDFTLKSLMRRKGKNISIVLLFSFLVFLFASVLFLVGSMKEEARKGLFAIPDITIQKLIAGRQVPIQISHAEKIKKIFGIEKVIPRVWGYYFDGSTQANYTIIGYDTKEAIWKEELGLILSGKGLSSKLAKGKVLVGEGVMKTKRLSPGVRFTLIDAERQIMAFKVIGGFKGVTDLHTSDILLMTEEDAKVALGLAEGMATDLGIYVYNPNEVSTIARKVSILLPSIRVITKRQLARSYDTVYSWRSGVILMTLMSCLLAFIMLAWDKASGLSAEEKREIGILKAIGWETSDILIMKFWEGLSISLLSFLFGITLAYIHIFVLGAPLLKRVVIGWSTLYPPFKLTPHLDFNQIFIVFFLAVIPYVLSTIIPSWKAAIIDPDTVIRGV